MSSIVVCPIVILSLIVCAIVLFVILSLIVCPIVLFVILSLIVCAIVLYHKLADVHICVVPMSSKLTNLMRVHVVLFYQFRHIYFRNMIPKLNHG